MIPWKKKCILRHGVYLCHFKSVCFPLLIIDISNYKWVFSTAATGNNKLLCWNILHSSNPIRMDLPQGVARYKTRVRWKVLGTKLQLTSVNIGKLRHLSNLASLLSKLHTPIEKFHPLASLHINAWKKGSSKMEDYSFLSPVRIKYILSSSLCLTHTTSEL